MSALEEARSRVVKAALLIATAKWGNFGGDERRSAAEVVMADDLFDEALDLYGKATQLALSGDVSLIAD